VSSPTVDSNGRKGVSAEEEGTQSKARKRVYVSAHSYAKTTSSATEAGWKGGRKEERKEERKAETMRKRERICRGNSPAGGHGKMHICGLRLFSPYDMK
jgi:hypothetical protein